MPSTIRDAECRCGQVRFRVTTKPVATMACHCKGCQRMTASAFSLGAMYPSHAFEVTNGDPVIGGLHGASNHFFCSHCMSWLFSRPQGLDQFVIVRTTMFDETASDDAPFFETWTSEKLPWSATPAIHSYEKFPPAAQFPMLLAEFAQRSA